MSADALLDRLDLETNVLTIAALDAARGKKLSSTDRERVLNAKQSVDEIIRALRETVPT